MANGIINHLLYRMTKSPIVEPPKSKPKQPKQPKQPRHAEEPIIEPKWYRVRQAAIRASVSPSTINNWMMEDKFEFWRVRKKNMERGLVLIDRESFERFLDSLTTSDHSETGQGDAI